MMCFTYTYVWLALSASVCNPKIPAENGLDSISEFLSQTEVA